MLLLVLCVACVSYALWTWRMRTHTDPQKPPYFRGYYPIIGHARFLIGDSKQTWTTVVELAKDCNEMGGAIRVKLGTATYYIITDPDDIMTAANACLTKHFAYKWAGSWLGNGLITGSGAIWKRHRQMILPAFSVSVLHGFLGVFNSQTRILVRNLSNKVGKGRFDVVPYIIENSLKSFCLTAIGVEVLDDEEFMKKYTQSIDEMLGFVMKRFTNVCLQSDFMYKLLGIKRKEDETIKILNDMCDNVIRKKRAVLKYNELWKEDLSKSRVLRQRPLVDLLLELSINNALTDEEIRDEVNTFIVAGYDTTSSTVAYTLMHLGTYPEVQDRVYNEIISVFGDSDRDLEKTDLSQLTYMETVIKETLRLYPIAPALLRHADTNVQLKKYRIPAGAEVVLLVYGQNRSPVWGADVNEFRPERWLQPHPAHSSAFGSFSLGKRYCLGQHYGMMSIKTTLVHVIRNYRVKANINELVLKLDFMMKPVDGCNIALEQRS